MRKHELLTEAEREQLVGIPSAETTLPGFIRSNPPTSI